LNNANWTIIVLAIITFQSRVLIIHRSKKDRVVPELSWAFPGGKIEKGETIEQSLNREVREEVGINLENSTLIFARVIPQTNILALYYHCSLSSEQKVTANNQEVIDYAWVTGEEALMRFTSHVSDEVKMLLLSVA
jgi:mutator protein MutT